MFASGKPGGCASPPDDGNRLAERADSLLSPALCCGHKQRGYEGGPHCLALSMIQGSGQAEADAGEPAAGRVSSAVTGAEAFRVTRPSASAQGPTTAISRRKGRAIDGRAC